MSLGGEKRKSFWACQNALRGGELNVLKLPVEANCSIHLVQKWQPIFITHVTCLWIPMVTEQRADLHKINHFFATASWLGLGLRSELKPPSRTFQLR